MRSNILLEGRDYAPVIRKMWVEERNGNLFEVNPKKYDRIKYYWRCLNCNKIFSARPLAITSMIDKGRIRCENCGKNKHYVSYKNSFEYQYPEVAKYWAYDKNILKPSEVSSGDNDKYWFYCRSCKKPFQKVLHSIDEKSECVCIKCLSTWEQNKRLNDRLAIDKNKDLMVLWDRVRNTNNPSEVSIKSRDKYYWVCSKCGESIYQSPDSILKNGLSCYVCKGLKYKKGFTDVLTVYRNVGVESSWSQRNRDKPEDVFFRSEEERLFLCKRCGKEFPKIVITLKNEKNGIYCSQCKHILSDLKIKLSFGECRPDLVSQWSKNNKLSPYEVLPSEITKYEWVCSQGHKFYRSPHERLNRRGECPICNGDEVLVGYNDLGTVRPDLIRYWTDSEKSYTEVTSNSSYRAKWICPLCGETYTRRIDDRVRHLGCPNCSVRNRSGVEVEFSDCVGDICSKAGLQYYKNYKLFGLQEVDFYAPSKNLAFEFNGVYWHSDKFLDRNYHYKKWKMAKNRGVSLVFIWEDEWAEKREIVLKMVIQKLGLSESEKVNARECEPFNIAVQDARNFAEENHIQGFVNGSEYIGLRDNKGNLRSLMILGLTDGEWVIKRYCTNCNLRGGFTKLLEEFHKAYNVNSVVTFSDNQISDGMLYVNSGFKKVKDIPVDYKYLVGRNRVHKFNFRKERFRVDPDLVYKEGVTEKELADLNGLLRVWDAGKVKYKKVWE